LNPRFIISQILIFTHASISNIQLSSVLAHLATFLCPKSKESVNKKMKNAQISYKQMGKTPGWEFYSDEMKPSPYGQNK
jgi:hypothetical protein